METEYAYTEYETDYATDAPPLPTPGETPFRTPLLSRRTSRLPGTASPDRHPSPNRRFGNTLSPSGQDEQYHEFDPRRFTPTLHANLVAEILSLRRELETKESFIDSLENDLFTLKAEQETTNDAAATAAKEARDAKRQLARAANDDGVAAIAAERDEAVAALNEVRKQMERLTVSRRKAQDDLERLKKIQERDAEKFEEAKRGFERRAHVAEGRLKAVLDELAAAEEAERERLANAQADDVPGSPQSVRSSVMSPTQRPMSMESIMSRRPMSLGMPDDEAAKLGMSLAQGLSLADELSFNNDSGSEGSEYESGAGSGSEDEDSHLGEEVEEQDGENEPGDMVSDNGSVDDDELEELPDLTDVGVQASESGDRIKILETEMEEKDQEIKRLYEIVDLKNAEIDALHLEIDASNKRATEFEDKIGSLESSAFSKNKEFYEKQSRLTIDIAAFEQRRDEMEQRWTLMDQKSKKVAETEKGFAAREQTIEEKERSLKAWQAALDEQDGKLTEKERTLGHREAEVVKHELVRDRDVEQLAAMKVELPSDAADGLSEPGTPVFPGFEIQATIPSSNYVTATSQTEGPSEPPVCVAVGMQTDGFSTAPTSPVPEGNALISTAVQTDKPPRPAMIHVPGIMVTPPPPTPPLPPPPPPDMRDVGVQTMVTRTRSHSMQTDVIKLDERLKNLPPHLLPATLRAKFASTSTTTTNEDKQTEAETKEDAEKDQVTATPASVTTKRQSKRMSKRRSLARPPSSFTKSTVKEESAVGSPLRALSSEDDGTNKQNNLPRSLFELSKEMVDSSGDEDFPSFDGRELDMSGNEYNTPLGARPRSYKPRVNTFGEIDEDFGNLGLRRRQNTLRKASGHASNSRALARSPSIVSGRSSRTGSSKQPGPPFPVPTRHSSRRPGALSDLERNEASTPRVGRSGSKRRSQEQSLRKSRSFTALSDHTKDESIKSPRQPTSSTAPGSPDVSVAPPIPARDEMGSAYLKRSSFAMSRHSQQPSNSTAPSLPRNSIGSMSQQTSVVDAIAQTMVGEWMWKYVRRRKSFGVGTLDASPTGDEGSGGTRHRRWVWLAPYERAIMWSSRQPTSGPALLGKSGRKLLIQSVLDVRDDTPLPKGASQPAFNRSILILTPARALKFTAPNRERHYVWLTALSFLSHSPESDGHLALPPPMPFEYEQIQKKQSPSPRGTSRKRDEQPILPPPPPIPASKPAFSPVRDSVKIHKGKGRAGTRRRRQASIVSEAESTLSAAPPSIPRFAGQGHGHARKRSYSAAAPAIRPSSRSTFNIFNDKPAPTGEAVFGVGGVGHTSNSSHWEAPSPTSAAATGKGTMRMAAFVDTPPVSRRRNDGDEESIKSVKSRNRQATMFGFDDCPNLGDIASLGELGDFGEFAPAPGVGGGSYSPPMPRGRGAFAPLVPTMSEGSSVFAPAPEVNRRDLRSRGTDPGAITDQRDSLDDYDPFSGFTGKRGW